MKATAQNNPITGFHYNVNEMSKSLVKKGFDENQKALEFEDNMYNLNNVNVKSTNFLPAIPA